MFYTQMFKKKKCCVFPLAYSLLVCCAMLFIYDSTILYTNIVDLKVYEQVHKRDSGTGLRWEHPVSALRRPGLALNRPSFASFRTSDNLSLVICPQLLL